MVEQEFYYKTIGSQQYPIIPIMASRFDKTIAIDVLIDSGADFCCFKSEVATLLGIPIERGQQKKIATASDEIIAYLHEIELQIFDKHITCKVAFSREFKFLENIAGRLNFFEAHEITFKEKEKKVQIKENQN